MRKQAIYSNGQAHLEDELRWLDAGLTALLEAGGGDPFVDPLAATMGLSISEEQLREADGRMPEAMEHWQSYSQLRQEKEYQIAATVRASLATGVDLPLARLVMTLSLTVWECRLLVLCLAGEWNRKYEQWFGYLNDDVTCRYVTPDLALRLLCDTEEERQYARERLGGDSVLRKLLLEPDEGGASSSSQAQTGRQRLKWPLRLDARAVSYLLATERLDARLTEWASAFEFGDADADALGDWPDDEVTRMMRKWIDKRSEVEAGGVPFLYLWGPIGGGKQHRLRMLASSRQQRLLTIDVDSLPHDAERLYLTLHRIVREAALTDAMLHWAEKRGTMPDAPAFRTAVTSALRDYIALAPRPMLAWTSRQQRRRADLPVPESAVYREAKVAAPAAAKRIAMWAAMGADEEMARDLGNKLRFTRGQISQAWERALLLASDRGETLPTRGDLELAARTQFNHRLAELADPIRPARDWGDLILPAESLSLIQEACNRFKHRETVLGQWGFGRKLPYGTGVHMLFAGPPGTGKTMTAEIVARELGLELYRIDLSRIVSKYIGETEQRLKELFDEAEQSGAILFFDEGDALFGKRTEVKDSHDRYANMEASYLLQRIEAYDGVTILATNLMQNMEEALIRRISVVVKFPAPGPAERELIFRAHLPPEAPVSDDLDLEFLAERMEVSGGQIKNIVLAAAFMAAAEQKPISMSHLVRASGQELRKTGKIFVKEIFAPYTDDL